MAEIESAISKSLNPANLPIMTRTSSLKSSSLTFFENCDKLHLNFELGYE